MVSTVRSRAFGMEPATPSITRIIWYAMRPRRPSFSEDDLKLRNQACFPLYAASRLLTQRYKKALEPLGLTYPQYLVMLVLWEADGSSLSEIGERLLLDSATLTPMLKKMEQGGLITRKRLAEDQRIVRHWLSPRGKALHRKALAVPQTMGCLLGNQAARLAAIKKLLWEIVDELGDGEPR